MDEGAADKRRRNVAERTDHSSPKLTTRKPWTARCFIVHGRTHPLRVGEYLADADENGERDSESEAQNPVKRGAEGKSPNSGTQSFHAHGVSRQPVICSTRFTQHGNIDCDNGSQDNEEPPAAAAAEA